MNEDHEAMARAQLRGVCFKMARLCLILSAATLIMEWLFPPNDRNLHVIGPSVFLMASSVFSLALCWPRRRS